MEHLSSLKHFIENTPNNQIIEKIDIRLSDYLRGIYSDAIIKTSNISARSAKERLGKEYPIHLKSLIDDMFDGKHLLENSSLIGIDALESLAILYTPSYHHPEYRISNIFQRVETEKDIIHTFNMGLVTIKQEYEEYIEMKTIPLYSAAGNKQISINYNLKNDADHLKEVEKDILEHTKLFFDQLLLIRKDNKITIQ